MKDKLEVLLLHHSIGKLKNPNLGEDLGEITISLAPLIPIQWAHKLTDIIAVKKAKTMGGNAVSYSGGKLGGEYFDRGENSYFVHQLTEKAYHFLKKQGEERKHIRKEKTYLNCADYDWL